MMNPAVSPHQRGLILRNPPTLAGHERGFAFPFSVAEGEGHIGMGPSGQFQTRANAR